MKYRAESPALNLRSLNAAGFRVSRVKNNRRV